jgi:CPA2 family monovalent cation:H+ antiporter-2
MPALAAGGVPEYLTPAAALVVAAFVVGFASVRARVVPIVGFLVAGVLIGPNAFGLVDEQEAVDVAAEVGVILLLFTIGIEFSLARLTRIRRAVLVGGGLQVAVTSLVVLGLLAAFGVGWKEGLFTGFLVALSSTAIVLKLLGDSGRTGTPTGQTTTAVLIFQDLAVVAMVLVVPMLGTQGGSPGELLLAIARALGIVAVVLVVARRVMPKVLEVVARQCSPEVFLLAVIAICFGTAYLTALAGVSVSLGAFLAGLVVSESRHSDHALGEILPLQILFSAAFFVSVGMLLDLGFLVSHLPLVLGAVAFVVVVKVLTTAVSVAVLRPGAGVTVATALLLAQVGEFSFVLQGVGDDAGLSPAGLGEDGRQTVVATTVLLMLATPALAALGRRAEQRWQPHRPARVPAPRAGGPNRTGHVVISGWGGAARALAADLRGMDVPLVVITLNPDGAAEAEEAGHDVVRGDSTKQHVLDTAGVPAAAAVVLPEDDPEAAAHIAAVVRGVNPTASIIVRPTEEAELDALAEVGVDRVVSPARTSSAALAHSVLGALGRPVGTPAAGAGWIDTTRLASWRPPAGEECPHGGEVTPVLPSAKGCEDCLRTGDTWVHLRLCLACGYVGCCDSSPNRHARKHYEAAGHPLAASLEPGETWAYCFLDDRTWERPDESVRWPTSARMATAGG